VEILADIGQVVKINELIADDWVVKEKSGGGQQQAQDGAALFSRLCGDSDMSICRGTSWLKAKE